ncbi:MAG: hypothetical protein QOG10_884 [Kribbellaceae bacterium]|jgi:hypothetical protein|nr:hypothetical protein [Kribbellaceae bacterium]
MVYPARLPGTCFRRTYHAGGGRKTHSDFPEALTEAVTTSIPSAVLANYVEIAGLSYLSSAGWETYNVDELPGPFRADCTSWST